MQSTDSLFILIKTLTRSEKRQFKLYATRLEVNAEAKFLLLFDIIDKMKNYNEDEILKSKVVTKNQLSNLKAHLYKQILVSLRMNPLNQNIRLIIREQLDFATILYHKGLFKQSLKILEKTKILALTNEEKNLAYEIIELEKVIETQYITRSAENRAEELIKQSKDISRKNVLTNRFSNLSLMLYNIMLKKGYAKNAEEINDITLLFNKKMPKYNITEMGFREKLWLYKTYLWYYLLVQDLVNGYKYAQKWVQLFTDYPEMIKINPVWYIKGVHSLLEVTFLLNYKSVFETTLDEFEKIILKEIIIKNDNNFILVSLTKFTHTLNQCFLSNEFEKGLELKSEIEEFLTKYSDKIDNHHVMVFDYKIACLHFGLKQYQNCIHYLNLITSNKKEHVKEELMCFAKVLNLISHYEAQLEDKLEYQIKSTYAFLLKMDNLQQVQKEMIQFIKNISKALPGEIKYELKKLYEKLYPLQFHPFEKRAFYYLDVISWIESKLENKSIMEVIHAKKKR